MNAEIVQRLEVLRRELNENVYFYEFSLKSDKERLAMLDNWLQNVLKDPKNVERSIIKTLVSMNERLEKLEKVIAKSEDFKSG
jgi:hypothetical protein